MPEKQNNTSALITVERHADGGWFFISSPAIPGLFLFGPDLNELAKELPDAVRLLQSAHMEKEMRQAFTSLTEQITQEAIIEKGWSKVQTPVTIPSKIASFATN